MSYHARVELRVRTSTSPTQYSRIWSGWHTSMILRADNERALQAVVRRIIQRATAQCQRYEQVAAEHPARYDSQSNGMTEVGVMLVRGLFRTLKLCLESSIARRIPEDHALVPWLFLRTCLLLNTAVKRADGPTAWHRARGRKFPWQAGLLWRADPVQVPLKRAFAGTTRQDSNRPAT